MWKQRYGKTRHAGAVVKTALPRLHLRFWRKLLSERREWEAEREERWKAKSLSDIQLKFNTKLATYFLHSGLLRYFALSYDLVLSRLK